MPLPNDGGAFGSHPSSQCGTYGAKASFTGTGQVYRQVDSEEESTWSAWGRTAEQTTSDIRIRIIQFNHRRHSTRNCKNRATAHSEVSYLTYSVGLNCLYLCKESPLRILLWFAYGSSTLDQVVCHTRTIMLSDCHRSVRVNFCLLNVSFVTWYWWPAWTDILNRIDPSYHRKPKIRPEDYVDPDPRTQAEHARHLSKYVFPRQYKLSSVFNQPARWKASAPDFSDRESEIQVLLSFFCLMTFKYLLSQHLQAKGSCKTPKRLKDILSLLEKMIWRHGKCGYKPLRDKACPSKVSVFDLNVF